MFDINKFLDDREKRVELQNSLLEKFKAPLFTVRANYPGENKWESIPIETVSYTHLTLPTTERV